MKKSLFALALFAFIGSASAHEGKGPHDHGKTTKNTKKATTCSAEAKAHCSGGGAASLGGVPSCCMKKGAKTAAATTPAVTAGGEVAVIVPC